MTLTIVSLLIAFVLALLFGVGYIDFLKKRLYKQYILEDAPENHKAKEGTPTTGGVFLVGAAILAAVITLFMDQTATDRAFIAIITLIFFTFAGFRDDLQKITNKKNKGITPRAKLALQIGIALLPTLYMMLHNTVSVDVFGREISLGYLYPLFAVFLIVGCSNAVNLTDGLDGLAGSNCFFAFIACAAICVFTGEFDLAIFSASIAGACLGFLYFNKHPAKVFMGDTGSLALGGMLGTIAVMGRFEMWLLLIGIIFMIETLSVMLQVASFKLTGKRIFKMSPIHHHFELMGWSEVRIVTVFSMITFIMCAIAVRLYVVLH